ncbi:MAG: IS4 family transposase, partial [Thermomicrobiales bacterium]
MPSLAQVADARQHVLTTVAEEAARATGCVRRRRAFSGASWVQTLVFGCLGTPQPSLETLTQRAAARGVAVTPQALDQRFTPEAAACLE